ncbi:MAG: YceI family protein [Ferruginibacter sp.]|nr:YceI family protein [Ferruginibacter sp.]
MIKWAIQKTSTIRIQGSTNINSFGCDIAGYYQRDTIYCSEENGVNKLVTLNGDLKVDIAKFDCHNKMLTGDLRKTLKADEYPKLVIRFISLERTPVIRSNKDFLRGWVEIELAGIHRRFEVCYTFVKTGSSLIQLNGNRNFSFADFKLVPPKKFAGLIKVKDNFNVDFNLLLDPVE